jgi:hypothetical protein
MKLFPAEPPPGTRRVIDVSGDGANNSGRPPADARDDAVAAGVVINGLPILNIEPDLDVHYREQVIGGPGSFMVAIETYDQFAEAIVRKLVTEIAANPAETTSVRQAKARSCNECGEIAPEGRMDLALRMKSTYTP